MSNYPKNYLVTAVCLFMVCILVEAQDTLFIYGINKNISKFELRNLDSITFTYADLKNSVSDYDGNIYETVTIGEQTWMKENLRVLHYNNGNAIPLITSSSDWENTTSGAYCWYNNDSISNPDFAPLYNHIAVNNALCPAGWHVPADAEWQILIEYLIANGYNFNNEITLDATAKALASAIGWGISSIQGAVGNPDLPDFRDKSGFSGKPEGFRYANGNFGLSTYGGYWWTSTEDGTSNGWCRSLYYSLTYVAKDTFDKNSGSSVRCIKD